MVQCLTDNRNRTVADIRHAFTRYGGNLGAEGSVGYLFNEVGMLGVIRRGATRTRSWRQRSMPARKTS